jgi:hypothetical protein
LTLGFEPVVEVSSVIAASALIDFVRASRHRIGIVQRIIRCRSVAFLRGAHWSG